MHSERRSENTYTKPRWTRAGRRLEIERQRISILESDIQGHMMGEPAEAFFPPPDNVIFLPKDRLTRGERRKKREGLIAGIRQTIVDLAHKQKEENSKSDNRITGSNPQEVFGSYFETDLFRETIKQGIVALRSVRDINYFKNTLAGRVFEDIAFGLLSGANNDKSVILSPQATTELAKALYPNNPSIEKIFGFTILKNESAYVPDGFCIDEENSEVQITLEYKLNPSNDKIYSQIQRFNLLKRRLPEIFSSKGCMLGVFPHGSTSVGLEYRQGVKSINAPFTTSDFTHYLGKIYSHLGIV